MPTPFLSSEEYDERAHQLYNEGQYDEALTVLREGLALYPTSVELHIGVGYARLAREEFAWASRSTRTHSPASARRCSSSGSRRRRSAASAVRSSSATRTIST